MAKDYARPFYDSKEWRKTREAYLQSQHYICERCGGAASVVHHIRYIKPCNVELGQSESRLRKVPRGRAFAGYEGAGAGGAAEWYCLR